MDFSVALHYLMIGLAAAAAFFVLFTLYCRVAYLGVILRIFENKPLFVVKDMRPVAGAESVEFFTPSGRRLIGSYLNHAGHRRRGVIIFCHEYGGNRWLVDHYLGYLRNHGFDLFAFDFSNHGESTAIAGYQPLQWVTEHEVEDVVAAIDYVRLRSGGEQLPLGLFGVSKGGGAALVAASRDRAVRALITDSAFPTHGTVTPYMQHYIRIYTQIPWVYRLIPRWYFAMFCEYALLKLQRRLLVRYSRLETAASEFAGRPWLAIHGERDSYIKVPIVRRFLGAITAPWELWVVPKAKHNGALDTAGDDYRARVVQFCQKWVAVEPAAESARVETARPRTVPLDRRIAHPEPAAP